MNYNKIVSFLNLKFIYRKIMVSTCHKEKLVRFELAFTSNMVKIYDDLKNKEYTHGDYNVFLIKEPKYRVIMSENMYDKIVNHLVSYFILIPCLEKKLIDTNVATRKGKGTKYGIFYLKKYLNKIKINHDNVYVLKCDISKYFYNINHEILFSMLKEDIKDENVFLLIKEIIQSTDRQNVNEKIDSQVKKEIDKILSSNVTNKDDLILELRRIPHYNLGKGLPIGNETSQILAIYYLNKMDHYIKEKLKVKYYIRYMDDFILIHHDKKFLKKCLKEINKMVCDLDLSLNKKTQIYDMKKGFCFLGYKFVFKGKKLIILVNSKTKKRIKRKLRKLCKKDKLKYELSKKSYKGYFIVANSKEFRYRLKI